MQILYKLYIHSYGSGVFTNGHIIWRGCRTIKHLKLFAELRAGFYNSLLYILYSIRACRLKSFAEKKSLRNFLTDHLLTKK